MAYSDQFLEDLRSRSALTDVIGRSVKLNQKGRDHIGLCPFHKEKTPSFTVNEEKGFYHCFGCGEHGSIFDFTMKTEGLSFPEAVEKLATELGMEIPRDSPEEQERFKKNQVLYEVTARAAYFYRKQLYLPVGKKALDYLKGRGFSDQTIKRFGIGYAGNGLNSVKSFLEGEKFDESIMISAGLIINPKDKKRRTYDRFRNRIIFPIEDTQGKVIAFGGRILGDGEPKYLNSPESPLFHKGRVLYGQKMASGPARKIGNIIVTEGYTDVIAMYQAGIENTVAPLGTALTEDQMRALWKIVPEPILCFDGDLAGKKAAARAAERALPLLASGYGLRFALLPDGEDPDSLIKYGGKNAIQLVIQGALPLSEVLWRIETGGQLPKTPERRAALEKRLKDYALKLTDPSLRSHFLSLFKERLWARSKNKRNDKGSNSTKWIASMALDDLTKEKNKAKSKSAAIIYTQKVLLAIIINHPDLFEVVEETLGNFSFTKGHLDNLRQDLISILLENTDLRTDDIKNLLIKRGLSDSLDFLFRDSLIISNRVIKTDAPIEKYQLLWEENVTLLKNLEASPELDNIRQSGETSIFEEDEDDWERHRALLEEAMPGCRD
jgi:DNA primase